MREVTITLPSRGLLYGDALPNGELVIREMTTAEEKLLASTTGDRTKVLDTILKKCIVTDFPYGRLLLGDKMFILISLRAETYGPVYEYTVKCGNCSQRHSVPVDLRKDLSVTVMTEEDLEPIEVTLPVSKHVLSLRHLRVDDELAIQRKVRNDIMRNSVKDAGDPSYFYRLASYISAIDGEDVAIQQALALIETMSGRDSIALRNAMEEHECGVDLILSVVCPFCGADTEELMQCSAEFFRPGITSIRRKSSGGDYGAA